ncbi:uncharacterized protein M421DRAFT_92636 [Didymella exigua CBS 183.55]|uniref:Uncharacterized protein n=1 Tax=Didymella exigua CBS 183.55 TaxID=1150837 RepID=A0A6A5RMM4_9PLEO|nr:uncharacterized protein M421DRAFT_92636 [Didymella exigua CBS 183.55]KAF1928378.1 hypothetical protein M421DRAFT_92636 [Didymella exigua CBS 183.55]
MEYCKAPAPLDSAKSCSSPSSPTKESPGSSARSKASSQTSPASSQARLPTEKYVPVADEEARLLARKAVGLQNSKSDLHHPTLLPDYETIFLAYHPSHDIETIKCSKIREDLSKFEQRLCSHRCTSDSTFCKSVQRKCGFKFLLKGSTPFFGQKSNGNSRVWHCSALGCKASAWIEMQSDTKMLTIEIKR